MMKDETTLKNIKELYDRTKKLLGITDAEMQVILLGNKPFCDNVDSIQEVNSLLSATIKRNCDWINKHFGKSKKVNKK